MSNTQSNAAVPSELKKRNRQLVLGCFRDHGEHTVADIVTRTGISKLTVMRAIQFFCAKGILVSSGKGESTEQGGKRPEYFRFSYRRYLLTIMLWPETLGLTLFDMNQQEICRSALGWIMPSTPEETFSFVRQQAAALLARAGIGNSDLYGVSLSTSGIVDYERLILKFSAHSPEWGSDIPVGDYLRDIFGPEPCIFVENAGKSISRTILQEQEDKTKRMLVLFTSWGLSGALIRDGQILNGRDSLIGELGHISLEPSDPEECSCGGHGCLERLVSVARLRRRILMDPPPAASPLAKLNPEEISLHHLFFASRQNDPYARAHVTRLAEHFALMLRNVAMVFNPEVVCFVGDYAIADNHFRNHILTVLNRCRYISSAAPVEIRYDDRHLPVLDARGGAAALLDHFFADPRLYEDPEEE